MSVVINGTTGITAAAFDGAVDAADLTGTLPAIDGSALTNLPAPTTAQVGSATAGFTTASVGAYAFCNNQTGGTLEENATVAGSSLRLSDSRDAGQSALSGTWRNMGKSIVTGGPATLFLRIS